MLGVGYKDNEMPYKKHENKPDIDEIVEWK
jgi:hypothetical protein